MNKSLSYSVCLSLLFLVSFNSQAQFSKGTKQVGGNLKFYQTSMENDYALPTSFARTATYTTREISVLPRMGVFVTNKFSTGASVGFLNNYTKSKSVTVQNEFEQKMTSNLLRVQVFGRYHLKITDQLMLFGEGLANMCFGKGKTTIGTNDYSEKLLGFGLGVKPGLILMLNEKLGLETSIGFLGYQQETRKPIDRPELPIGDTNTQRDYGLSLALATLDFGMQYYF
jgi:hypothetical protein